MNLTEQQLDKYIKVTISLIIVIVLISGGLYYYYYVKPSQGKLSIVDQQVAELQKRVRKNPKNVNARIYLAQAYLKNDEIEPAIAELKEVVKLDKENEIAYYLLGYAYKLQGKESYGLAKKSFSKVVKLTEGTEFAKINSYLKSSYFFLGEITYETEKYKDAAQYYIKSSEIGSKDSDAFRKIGKAYFKLKDYKKAEKYYKEALRFVPNYAEVYADLGEIYRAQGNKAKAKEQYDKALEYKSDLKEAKEGLEEL